jgi:putative copper export protein
MASFDAAAVAMRCAAFIAALQAAGLAFFMAAHRSTLAENAAPLVSLARTMTLAALALVLGHQVIEAARLAGDWPGMVDFDMQRGNWHRSPGVSALVAGVGLAIEHAGFRLKNGSGRTLTLLGALAVVASFALTGHTTDGAVWPPLRLVLAAHVSIVAYWLASVVVLLRLTRVAPTPVVYRISTAFSDSAVWIVPLILPLGVAVAIGLLPGLAALRTVYGALLASKLGGFVVILCLAALNRWRMVPALERQPLRATRRFRRALQAEYLLLVGVVSVTAVMTSLYSWH